MDKFINLFLSGAVSGGIYAVMAAGLVLTYQTSGMFNFAHGAVAFVTAFLLACLGGVATSGLAAADDAVRQTKHELRQARERVRDRRAKIRTLEPFKTKGRMP